MDLWGGESKEVTEDEIWYIGPEYGDPRNHMGGRYGSQRIRILPYYNGVVE